MTHSPSDPYANVSEPTDPNGEDAARRYEPPSGYMAPGSYNRYTPPPSSTSSTLGWVALGAGVVGLVGSIVTAAIVVATFTPASVEEQVTAGAILGVGMMLVLLVWFPFGLWAMIQGIVAIAQRRGRWQGVVALILGTFGPWVGVVIALIGVTASFAGL